MILEMAELCIRSGQSQALEEQFRKARPRIASIKGYCSHELKIGIEKKDRFLLLVHWETLEDDEIGFRQSDQYQEWKRLLHHFYEPFPEVLHYQ